MKSTTTILAGLAALLPSTLAAKAYVPYAYNTSIPAIHLKPVSAVNGWFYINIPTTATCPSYDPGCPSQNTTIISGPTPNFWMGVLEAGGQEIFSSGYATGTPLGYAAADSDNYLPYASTTGSFGLANTTDGRVLFQEWGANWSACNVDYEEGMNLTSTGQFSVWQGYKTNLAAEGVVCYGFEMVLVETDAPAVQYYDCAGCEHRCNNRYNIGCS